jgi:5-methyltetrahydrofolate--homocysteine methyltransferase
MVTDGNGRLLSGEAIEDAVAALEPGDSNPDVLSINCVPAGKLGADLGRLAAAAPGVPLAAYGNLGLPADDRGWAFTEQLSPERYAELARGWLALGARIVGGCCGTTAAHTAALRYAISIASPNE